MRLRAQGLLEPQLGVAGDQTSNLLVTGQSALRPELHAAHVQDAGQVTLPRNVVKALLPLSLFVFWSAG